MRHCSLHQNCRIHFCDVICTLLICESLSVTPRLRSWQSGAWKIGIITYTEAPKFGWSASHCGGTHIVRTSKIWTFGQLVITVEYLFYWQYYVMTADGSKYIGWLCYEGLTNNPKWTNSPSNHEPRTDGLHSNGDGHAWWNSWVYSVPKSRRFCAHLTRFAAGIQPIELAGSRKD